METTGVRGPTDAELREIELMQYLVSMDDIYDAAEEMADVIYELYTHDIIVPYPFEIINHRDGRGVLDVNFTPQFEAKLPSGVMLNIDIPNVIATELLLLDSYVGYHYYVNEVDNVLMERGYPELVSGK